MKQFILSNKKAIAGISAALLIGIITMSFQDNSILEAKYGDLYTSTDTLPANTHGEHMKMKDFDKLDKTLEETLSQSLDKVNIELKNIDFSSIEQNVENALKNVDLDHIMQDVNKALKDVNVDKILEEVNSSLKDVAMVDNKEVDKAMKEAREEIERSKKEFNNIDMKEIRDAVEKAKEEAKNIDMKELRNEMEKASAEIKNMNMDKVMEEAKEGISKAKESLQQTKVMFGEMENDGLINSKEGFSIDYKNKELFINGKKQDEKVTAKYRKYFTEDHFSITIDKE